MTGSGELAAAVLVGGRATRMAGAVKALLPYRGRRIIDWQLEVLGQVTEHVALCTSDPRPFRQADPPLPALPVISDHPAGVGPMAAIAAALVWSPAAGVVIIAGDMPRVSVAVVRELVAVAGMNPDADVVAPRAAGVAQPLCALYRARASLRWVDALRAGDRSPRRVLESGVVPVVWIDDEHLRRVDPDLSFATNVNEPSDLL